MLILPGYIVRRHLGPFIFGLSVIIFVFLINFIFQNLYKFIGKGLSLWTIAEVIGLSMAWMAALAVPMAALISTVMAFGKLSEDNEITAMRAGGIGPLQIIIPAIALAGILAAALVWFNNRVLPEANHRARLLMSDIFRAKPALNFQEGVFSTQIPDMRILIKKIDPNSPRIENILILDNSDRMMRRSIIAMHGSFVFSTQSDRMILTLYSGEIHEVSGPNWDRYTRLKFREHVIAIPMEESGFRRTESGYRGDREISAQDMLEEIRKARVETETYQKEARRYISELGASERLSIREAIDSLTYINSDILSKANLASGAQTGLANFEEREIASKMENLQTIASFIENRIEYIRMLSVEVHKKYSIPIACIVFVLIGAPLGMMLRRGSMAFSGGISLGFFIIYWAFLIGGEELADRGIVPPESIWAPNILLGALGAWWIYRMSRLSPLPALRQFISGRRHKTRSSSDGS